MFLFFLVITFFAESSLRAQETPDLFPQDLNANSPLVKTPLPKTPLTPVKKSRFRTFLKRALLSGVATGLIVSIHQAVKMSSIIQNSKLSELMQEEVNAKKIECRKLLHRLQNDTSLEAIQETNPETDPTPLLEAIEQFLHSPPPYTLEQSNQIAALKISGKDLKEAIEILELLVRSNALTDTHPEEGLKITADASKKFQSYLHPFVFPNEKRRKHTKILKDLSYKYKDHFRLWTIGCYFLVTLH